MMVHDEKDLAQESSRIYGNADGMGSEQAPGSIFEEEEALAAEDASSTSPMSNTTVWV